MNTYIRKGSCLLEKACNKVDRKDFWDVLRIYEVEGIYLKSCYEGMSAFACDEELCEF